MLSTIGSIALVIAVIVLALVTRHHKRALAHERIAGDRSFRLHTRALDRDARIHYRGY